MGTIIPSPVNPGTSPAGSACALCWGIGKPFGDGDTPETVTVSVSGVNKAPGWIAADGEPFNGVAVLSQDLPDACIYHLIQGNYIFDLFWDGGNTEFEVQQVVGAPCFVGLDSSPCILALDNIPSTAFTGGSVKIILPELE